MVQILSSIIAIVAVTAIAWLYSQQKRRHRLLDHHREWITDAIKSITAEADRTRLHLGAIPKIDVPATFEQLRSLVADQPGEIISDVEEMERLWNELRTILAEISQSSPNSTLANSVGSARASKIASRIDELGQDILRSLE